MEQKEITKTRLIIYVLMAYGLTYLMGILMWYGSTKGYDLTVFPTAQMMYPAAGLIDYYHGNKLVLINKSATSRDGQADLVISDSIGKVLGDAVGV